MERRIPQQLIGIGSDAAWRGWPVDDQGQMDERPIRNAIVWGGRQRQESAESIVVAPPVALRRTPGNHTSRAARKAARRARTAGKVPTRRAAAITDSDSASSLYEYDAFISYAGEDRDAIAGPLSEALAERGWTSWFADREFAAGDRPRATIDRGLSRSRFGVVIFSPSYFGKFWPEAELDALIAREESLGRKVIVPVLHEMSRRELQRHSPIMASRISIRADRGVDDAADRVSQAFEKELGSQRTPAVVKLSDVRFDLTKGELEQAILKFQAN